MRRTHRPVKRCLELLPASLLPFKKGWQAISRDLPAGTYLLFVPDHNPRMERQMRVIAQVCERRGRRVKVLRTGDLHLEK